MSDIRPETKFQGSIPPETSDFILPKAFKAPNQVNKLQFQLDLTSSTPQNKFSLHIFPENTAEIDTSKSYSNKQTKNS